MCAGLIDTQCGERRSSKYRVIRNRYQWVFSTGAQIQKGTDVPSGKWFGGRHGIRTQLHNTPKL